MEYIKNNKKEIVFIFLVTLIALFFRVIALKNAGDLWIDEIYSYYFSSKNSVLDVIKSLYNEDLHTPLYFILLHFWIKFTGENDTMMRLLGFIPALFIVPFSYYAGKNLFNKKTGVYASLILAFSPFLIYYTTELRFYGLACFLTLLSSYFFVKFLQNGTGKIALIVSNLLLLYTFNISFVFVFFQFLIAIFYSKNKIDILKTYFLTGIFYIPGFIMTLHGIFSYKNSICSFSKDIFIYKPAFFSIFLQSYFSGNFYFGTQNNYEYNSYIMKNIFNIKNLCLILFPVIFCITGFLKGIINGVIEKNKALILFLAPAILFLMFEFIMASTGLMSLTVRYTLISFPVVILVCAYGFSFFKNKYIINTFFILFLISMYTFIFAPQSPIDKDVEFGSPVKSTLNRLNIIKKDDYILIPIMGKLYRRYIPKANYLDFEITDMLLNDVRKYYENIFDIDTIKKLNQQNAREILYDYTVYNTKSPELENYLNGYFKDFKKGTKFIVLINNMNTISSMSELYKKTPSKKRELYYKNSLYYMLITRIVFDILDVSNKYLKLKTHFVINDSKYSDNNTGVFIFVKE